MAGLLVAAGRRSCRGSRWRGWASGAGRHLGCCVVTRRLERGRPGEGRGGDRVQGGGGDSSGARAGSLGRDREAAGGAGEVERRARRAASG
jgi:hypothetical protein